VPPTRPRLGSRHDPWIAPRIDSLTQPSQAAVKTGSFAVEDVAFYPGDVARGYPVDPNYGPGDSAFCAGIS